MNTPRTLLIFLCLWGLASLASGQDVRNSLKVGVATGGLSQECLLVSAEHAFGSTLSGVLQGGWSWHRGYRAQNDGTYQIGLHGRIDLRAYFALRRDLRLSGFYVSGSAGYDRINTRARGISTVIVRRYSPEVGIGFGYQHLFRRGFCMDLGTRLLRSINYRQETYDTGGNLLFTDDYSYWWFFTPYLGVGWSF